jgi:hypothetical protein
MARISLSRKTGSVKSAKRKLARAAKHLKTIKVCIADYSASRPFKIIPDETDGKNTNQVRILKPPPVEISILAGEMLYQMRSALDHLAFGLVERNIGHISLPPKWVENSQFPLSVKIPKNKTGTPYSLPAPYNVFTNNLPGISKAAFTFIERLQPYYRRGATNNALGVLVKLSNIDKHRYLNIVVPLVQRTQTVRYRSGVTTSGFDTFHHGAQFYTDVGRKTDRAVQVNRRFRVPVHFNELDFRGDPITIPLESLLKLILGEIKTNVVPALDKFINAP